MHIGIYAPLAQDAISESKAAAMGGVTSSLNYIRTGHYYLNRGGPYRAFMAEVHKQAKDKFWVDYRFHIAPIESAHIDEMEHLVTDHGVTSFKIFMFYGGYGLHGASSQQNEFLMIGPDERYDIARFEFIMRGAQRLMEKFPKLAPVHQRQPALRAGGNSHRLHQDRRARRQAEGPSRLQRGAPAAFGRARHLDRVLLANETNCLNINLLQSELAQGDRHGVDDAASLPHVTFRREVTVGRLLLRHQCECAVHAKVSPPSARGRMSRRSGRACLTARSTRSSASVLLLGRAEWSRTSNNIWLAKIRLWRHRMSSAGGGQRGQQRGMSSIT